MSTRGDIDVDLAEVGFSRRGSTWRRWSEDAFHNVDLVNVHKGPLEGSIRGFALGDRRLIRILSAGRTIARKDRPLEEPFLTLLVQLSGITQIQRGDHSLSLAPGDIGVIDGANEFRQSHSASSEFLLFQTRRGQALADNPAMVLSPLKVYSGELHATRLLRNALLSALDVAAHLSGMQRRLLGETLFRLAGLLSLEVDDGLGHSRARRRDAQVLIEEELGSRALSPATVATRVGMSRRRLDELFARHVGKTVSGYIWERRLLRASALLRDPSHESQTIAEICMSVGFEDCSHFSKLFRSRFGLTPRAWRKSAGSSLRPEGSRLLSG